MMWPSFDKDSFYNIYSAQHWIAENLLLMSDCQELYDGWLQYPFSFVEELFHT